MWRGAVTLCLLTPLPPSRPPHDAPKAPSVFLERLKMTRHPWKRRSAVMRQLFRDLCPLALSQENLFLASRVHSYSSDDAHSGLLSLDVFTHLRTSFQGWTLSPLTESTSDLPLDRLPAERVTCRNDKRKYARLMCFTAFYS